MSFRIENTPFVYRAGFVVFFVMLVSVTASFAADITFTSSTTVAAGDNYGNVFIRNDGTVIEMSGGTVTKDIALYDASKLNMSGGTIEYDINIHNSGIATVFSGAAILDDVYVYDSGTLLLRGGAISDNLQAYGSTVVEIGDGSIGGNLGIHDSCETAIHGGSTDYVLWADGNSEVFIYGRNLAIATSGGAYGYGVVTGLWANWAPFQIDFDTSSTYTHVDLIEVPEPATMGMLVLGGLAMLRRRKHGTSK